MLHQAQHATRHWSGDYLGLVGRDPEAPEVGGVDCLDLLRAGLGDQAGIRLPAFGATMDAEEAALLQAAPWLPVTERGARALDVAVFGRAGIEAHAGLLVSEPGEALAMLHVEAGGLSVVEEIDGDKWRGRRLGIYRHAGLAAPLKGFARLPVAPPPENAVTVVGLSMFDPTRDLAPLVVPVLDGRPPTLAELVALTWPAAGAGSRQAMRVTIGDAVLPFDRWERTRPKAGAIVRIMPVPGFSFRMFLQLLVQAAAVAAGTLIGGIPGALAGLAISVGGGLLVNALAPPPRPPGQARDAPSLTGWRNEVRLNAPFPLPLGKRRHAPPVIGPSYLLLGEPEAADATIVKSRTLRLRTLFCEGIEGADPNGNVSSLLVTKQQIAETAIADYKGVTVQTLSWSPGDAPPSLYPEQVVATPDVAATLLRPGSGPEAVIRNSARFAAAITCIFSFPTGLGKAKDSGEIATASVFLKIEQVDLASGVRTIVDPSFEISDDTFDAFFVSRKWSSGAESQFAVEVTRLDDDTQSDVRQRCDWIALYTTRARSPLNARVPLKVTAIEVQATDQLQGQLNSYNSVVSRSCLDYDAVTKTWLTRETASPGAVLRFALQGPHLAVPKTDAELDLVNIVDFHDRCRPKGLAFHSVVDADVPLQGLVADIAASGRASPHHDGRRYGVVIDRARTRLSGHVTAQNVVAGSFGASRAVEAAKLPDATRVTFHDSANGYKRSVRTVPRQGLVGAPNTFLSLDLPWEVDAGRAWREARRRQLIVEHRPIAYRARIGWDHLIQRRGNRVFLNHHVLDRGQTSSRVIGVTGNTVLLADPLTQIEGAIYELRYWSVPPAAEEAAVNPLPGLSRTRAVVTVPGRSASLILAGAGPMPDVGDTAFIGGYVDAFVAGIQRADKLGADIVFAPNAPQIEAETDAEVVPAWNPVTGDAFASAVPPPAGFAASMLFQVSGGALRGFARFAWTASPGLSYQVAWRTVGAAISNIIDVQNGRADAVTAQIAAADDYEGRIRVQGSALWSPWLPVPDVVLIAEDETLVDTGAGSLLQA